MTFELPGIASEVVASQVESPDVPKPGERIISSFTMGQEPRESPFARQYRIQNAEGERLGDVLVVDQPWFDEALCYCGAIVMEQFAIEDGNLLQFSQMAEGVIKIAQATNGTHRAKLDEWTHSKIPTRDFERIGVSLRLHVPSKRTRDEWIDVTRAKRGRNGVIGWLRTGMTVEDLRKIMGVPVKSDASGESYEARRVFYDGHGYLHRLTLPVSGGKLMAPAGEWRQVEEIVPPHQVPDEMEKLVKSWSRSLKQAEEKAAPADVGSHMIPQDQIQQVKEAFQREAPLAGGKQWEDWCGLLIAMNRVGVRDTAAAEMVARRFVDVPELRNREAVEIIDAYGIPGRYAMMASLVEQILDSPGQRDDAHCFFSIASMAEKGGLLTSDHIRKAVDHPNAEIRHDSSLLIDALPRLEARESMKKLMVDPDPSVREQVISIAPRFCELSDESWLRKLADQETDPGCRMYFRVLLDRLKEGR
ncbi:MAG: hypothetical protein EOP87_06425 [Verrucomicrobiaceae bacterium]|nr:MAG: hypothetical protein EOP87_06425 [Verrucomicrobiaceae bacterium]